MEPIFFGANFYLGKNLLGHRNFWSNILTFISLVDQNIIGPTKHIFDQKKLYPHFLNKNFRAKS